jgi:hypothetical protein
VSDQTALLQRLVQLIESAHGASSGSSGDATSASTTSERANSSTTAPIKKYSWSDLHVPPVGSIPKELGSGAFGVVREYTLEHRLVAVKELKGTLRTGTGSSIGGADSVA